MTDDFDVGDSGKDYYNLIIEKNVSVVFEEIESEEDTFTFGYFSLEQNKIVLNPLLPEEYGWTPEALAAVVVHEATHVDYTYNPVKWVGRILDRWPTYQGVTLTAELLTQQMIYLYNPETQLYEETPYLFYSITEEYFTNCNEAQAWEKLKNGYEIPFLDGKVARYYQGEDAVRAYLRQSYDLPEFYADEPPL